jgi:hypothetical protein
MPEKITEKFIEALEKLEETGDVEKIASLFSETGEIGNVTLTKNLSGVKGAKEFWTNYRQTFDTVKSTFKNIIITDGTAALEWTSEGTTSSGNKFNYEGVSVLEVENEKITRFFAYFNPAKLGHQIEEAKASAG